MKKHVVLLMVTLLTVTPASLLAGDAAAGKARAAVCAACHGPDGKSMNPLWPHLAGQQDAYLAKQIKDFRDGRRQDPTMAPMVAALSDSDIENLAAFYASQKP